MSDKLTATLYLDDAPFEVEFNFYPGERQTYLEPGSPDDVELESISFGGVKFTDDQETLLIESYGEKEFEEWMFEEAYSELQIRQEAHDDYLYEQHKDKLRGL